MELSKSTLTSLESLLNPEVIDTTTFDQLIDFVALDLTRKADGADLSKLYDSAKPEVVKSAYADVVSLFVEAARNRCDAESFGAYLHANKITGSRAEKLCAVYGANRDAVISQLNCIGDSLPRVIDVDWRLDYCIKTSTDNDVGECLYHVRFKTKKNDKVDYVEFTCTLQQLQDIVYQLKDALRHVERIASTSS